MKLIQRIKQRILRTIKSNSSTPQEVSRLSSQSSNSPISTITPHWNSGLVLVCSQCGKERSRNNNARIGGESAVAEDLRTWLKSRLKAEGLSREVRVVSTSCLGVCPKSRIAIVLGSDAGSGGQCLSFDLEGDREILYSQIKQKIRESTVNLALKN